MKTKKILSLLLVAALCFSFAACGNTAKAPTVDSPVVSQPLQESLPEVIEKIYERHPLGEMAVGTMDGTMLDISDTEVLKMFTGLEDSSLVKDLAVSEPMIGSIPYSLVLVRVNDGTKTEEVAQKMLDGIDCRKWICVEADDVKVATYSDVAMLIMVGTDYAETVTAQNIVDAFTDVCGGTLDKVLEK